MHLFEYYSCVRHLPVSIDGIVDHLRDAGFVYDVHFHEVDIDPEVLWAMVRVYRPITAYNRDIPPVFEVMYSKHLTEEQRRFACCKELLHSLDDDDEKATSEQAVEKLIQHMTIPPNAGISIPAINDHLGAVKALMVLVPADALAELKKAFDDGEISEAEIAKAVMVPVEYVRLTLSPIWEELAEAVLQQYKRH